MKMCRALGDVMLHWRISFIERWHHEIEIRVQNFIHRLIDNLGESIERNRQIWEWTDKDLLSNSKRFIELKIATPYDSFKYSSGLHSPHPHLQSWHQWNLLSIQLPPIFHSRMRRSTRMQLCVNCCVFVWPVLDWKPLLVLPQLDPNRNPSGPYRVHPPPPKTSIPPHTLPNPCQSLTKNGLNRWWLDCLSACLLLVKVWRSLFSTLSSDLLHVE